MKDGDDTNKVPLDVEVDAVSMKFLEPSLRDRGSHQTKALRVFNYAIESLLNFEFEFLSRTRSAFVTPRDGVFKLEPCLRIKDYLSWHARLFSRRCLSSARTCCPGIPCCGLRRSSRARVSSRAMWSGVGSCLCSVTIRSA